METLIQQLIRHEGLRLFPYRCLAGKLTIGVGRNIEERGITEHEAMYLLQNDIDECKREVNAVFPSTSRLDQARYNVILNMCFNVGVSRLKQFKKMWTAIEDGDYYQASLEMLDSKWAKQVGPRAIELAEIMRHGG